MSHTLSANAIPHWGGGHFEHSLICCPLHIIFLMLQNMLKDC